ncbi:MAG: tetratricopeptide repeat protein [Deltaproteobacteria bacterium]|nr:tetratricopeptide repeat protein [Deltaproteobacteria bacterium]
MLACPTHPVVVPEELAEGFFCMVCGGFVEPVEVDEPASEVVEFRRMRPPKPPPSLPTPPGKPTRGAIARLLESLAKDPDNARILQRLGELHQRRGEVPEAVSYFTKVGAQYELDGFFLKAVAVYKQVLKLEEVPPIRFKLANLYQQLGLMRDAMTELGIVAKLFEEQGGGDALGDVLRKMVALDPDNVASRIKLAELYVRENDPRALEEFGRAASYLERNERWVDLLKVANRMRFLAPDRDDFRELVERTRVRLGQK